MANRYWVGGAGTWNTTSTTNWSASSGGSGGASVPTAADDVFFDQAGTYAVTLTGSLACKSWTVSAGVVTFTTGTTPSLSINGDIAWTAGTVAFSGTVFTISLASAGTKTITTNGVSLPANPLNVSGVATYNLGSAFATTGSWVFGASAATTLNTNGYALTCAGLYGTGTMNWGASTVTVTGATIFAASSAINLNAGTSQLNLSAASLTLHASGVAGHTFYNVSCTNAAATSIAITSTNTFNTLSFAGRTSVGITPVTFNNTQTISTLTLNAGTAAAYRTFLASDTIGTQRTLSVGTLTAGAADYDFRDIAITGAASPIAPTRAGDCKDNSGITFPAAKTVYWRSTGTGTNWGNSAAVWSATNGGTADATQFPLAQDTAVFPSSPTPYPPSGNSVTINANYNIGTIDMSARTSNTMTLATGTTTPAIYGNWINGTGTALSGTGNMTFAGRGTQTITSAGKTFTQPITINSPSGSVTLQDAFTNTNNTAFVFTQGTFSADSYNVTLPNQKLSIGGSGVRTLDFGSGTWTLAQTGLAFQYAGTNLTVTGTGVISLTAAGSKTFAGGDIQTYPTLNQGGSGALTISGSNKFADITNTYAATGATSVLFTAGTTNEFTAFNLTGQATRVCTLGSTTTSQATLKKPSTWYMGANSTDAGNNTNLTFTAGGGIDYLSVSYINGIVATAFGNNSNFFAFF